jgi:predicted O-linked N-acetylglucosamine transferase (SPINDLY family)
MPTIAEALATAVAYHQAGRLRAAEQAYQAVLAADPNHPEALHLLGVIQHQLGRHQRAIELIERAIAAQGDQPIYHNNLGESYRSLRRVSEAIACYRRALQLNPAFAGAHYNLGNALKDEGRLPEAIAAYRRALELRPDYPAALNNLGNAYKTQGQLAEAVACLERAVQLKPDFAEAHNNLGNAWKEQRQMAQALACFQRALDLAPQRAEFHSNLGNALHDVGRRDEALAAYRRAMQLNPDFAEVHFGLGHAMHDEGELTQAIDFYQRALALKPDYSEALNNLANAWKDQGQLDEALTCFDRALALKPDNITALSNRVFTLQYRAGITLPELFAAHQAYERQHAAPHRGSWMAHENVRDPNRRLRLGFVSPDFSRHPVGYFLVRAIENLNPQTFETVCYHDRWSSDEWTARFRAAAAVWRPIAGQGDEQVAEQIRADRVDILFDLTGHTARNRLLVFARKPAPVQISWIGYEGTTGLTAIDYILADRYVIPFGSEQHYVEQVLRMPHGYLCYDPPAAAPPVGPPAALAAGFTTFCSFNNLSKITPQVVAVWAKILRSVPQSRLILQYKGLGDETVKGRYKALFAECGVDARQLDLRAPTPYADYLASYGEVDIALDPFPFAGGTITCEALWMGVPVVTCPGETFASRHTLSHLSNIGITETIARDLDEYVEIAIALARDLPRLGALRAGLRERMAASPLCDGKQFAMDLGALLRVVWRRWLQN